MKRIIFILFALFIFTSSAFSWDAGGWDSGVFSSGLFGIGYVGGSATDMVTGTTAIPLNYAVVKKTVGAATDQAGTLADGIQGQMIKIILTAKNSSGNFVLTPTTKTGFSSITFNSAGDQAILLFVGNSVGWIIFSETGTSITS